MKFNQENTRIVRLRDNLIITSNERPNIVVICSESNTKNHILLTKEEVLNVFNSKLINHLYYKELTIRDIDINIGNDWLLFVQKENIIQMYFDTFNKLVDYLKESRIEVV